MRLRQEDEYAMPRVIHCKCMGAGLRLDCLDAPPVGRVDDVDDSWIADGDVEVLKRLVEEDHVRWAAELQHPAHRSCSGIHSHELPAIAGAVEFPARDVEVQPMRTPVRDLELHSE